MQEKFLPVPLCIFWRKGYSMRFKKTPYCKRNRYKLYDDFGEEILEIKVGEYGVTEEDIRKFHAVDDHEVYINCKEMRVSPFETDIYQKWKNTFIKNHGYSPEETGHLLPHRQTISSDFLSDSEFEIQFSEYDTPIEDESILRLHEMVAAMPGKWQKVYQLAMLGGFTNVETAKLLNISEGRVRALRRKIEEKIRSDEILKNFFD